MRNIFTVIDKIKEIVPLENEEFLQSLEYIRNDASYRAPEVMVESWHKFVTIFNENIPFKPFRELECWQQQAIIIFTDREKEEQLAAAVAADSHDKEETYYDELKRYGVE